ncbi:MULTISPECIES: LemA family protein [unclassified Brevundimonas]|uniref:LemA family protein n=1 Tax=unclassified Brevundimonas TaxID=2622653 RepID=UPI000700A6F5|nr:MULTISPECIES: LemA family protein [unclassified Brevundimonas]KQY86692.1 LemA family protein [Brevundimonas sp. Root1423]KRA19419.1 LemA family protein [Brevundimonas sp. Root608]
MIRFSPRVSALAAVVVLAPAAAGCGINAIPTKEEAAKARWADVQSQYQRRADLVPNLVATVQGAAIAERTTLTQVIEARAAATGVTVTPETLSDPAAFQRYQAAQGQLSQALSRLLLVVERYPEIKSNQNFIALQSQLEGTENRIAVSRRDYNEAVRDYNTSLRTFPTVIWAKTIHGGSEPMQLFTATETAQTAPNVNFDALNPSARPGGAAPAVAPGAAPPAAPTAQ